MVKNALVKWTRKFTNYFHTVSNYLHYGANTWWPIWTMNLTASVTLRAYKLTWHTQLNDDTRQTHAESVQCDSEQVKAAQATENGHCWPLTWFTKVNNSFQLHFDVYTIASINDSWTAAKIQIKIFKHSLKWSCPLKILMSKLYYGFIARRYYSMVD